MEKTLIRSRSCLKLRLLQENRKMKHQETMTVTTKKKIGSRGVMKIKRRRRRNRSKWKRLKIASMIERRAKIARLYTHHLVSQKRRWVEKGSQNRSLYLKFRISSKESQ